MSPNFSITRLQSRGVRIAGVLLVVVFMAVVVTMLYRFDASKENAVTVEEPQEAPQAAQVPQASQPEVPPREGSPGSEFSVIQGSPCPVELNLYGSSMQCRQGANLESWQVLSERDCRVVARELLLELQGEGTELVRAGDLDLSGEAWGCTVKTPNEEALIVSLIPEQLGFPRGENNRLIVTVTRIAKPELGQEREKA